MSDTRASDTGGPSVRRLPPGVYDLVAHHLAPNTLASARLSCKSFATAPGITAVIQSLTVASWAFPHMHNVASRLPHVKHMHAVVANQADWSRMQQLAIQLPELKSIQFTGKRSWYRMNSGDASVDIIYLSVSPSLTSLQAGCSTSAANQHRLPSLSAISFEGIVRGLDDVAALAPQLQQLHCSKLIIPKYEPHQQPPQLPHLTHFGSSYVHVDAEDTAEAAEAFAAAFPALQVLFQTPEFGANVVALNRIDKTKVPLQEVLDKCNTVRSVRVFGSSTAMCGFIPQQLRGLQHILRLSVYGIGPAAELKGIRHLTQLQQLRLSFEVPTKRAAKAVLSLLDELVSLPRLQQLALPAKLVCPSCCPYSYDGVNALALHCAKSSCQLLFLQRPLAGHSKTLKQQAGDYCPHFESGMQGGFRALQKCIAYGADRAPAALMAGPLAAKPITDGTSAADANVRHAVQGAAALSSAVLLQNEETASTVRQSSSGADMLQMCMLLADEWQHLPFTIGMLQRHGHSSSSIYLNTWDVYDAVCEWHAAATPQPF